MQYGLTLPGRGPLATADNLAMLARRGEELGYDMVLAGIILSFRKTLIQPTLSLYGDGPIDTLEGIRPALERALRVVKTEGTLALVRHRHAATL